MAPVHRDADIETAIIALGREPGGGLVVPPAAFSFAHRAWIISAAAGNNVPAVYTQSAFARDGGLLSYGVDLVDTFRRAATYVDRILRGEKPGDLPVQLPTKFEMVVNRKTATALGLAIPPSILLRATRSGRITAGYVGLWHCTSFAAVQQNPTLSRALRTMPPARRGLRSASL
jgi:putative ABC transport system substrate-binding protein